MNTAMESKNSTTPGRRAITSSASATPRSSWTTTATMPSFPPRHLSCGELKVLSTFSSDGGGEAATRARSARRRRCAPHGTGWCRRRARRGVSRPIPGTSRRTRSPRTSRHLPKAGAEASCGPPRWPCARNGRGRRHPVSFASLKMSMPCERREVLSCKFRARPTTT